MSLNLSPHSDPYDVKGDKWETPSTCWPNACWKTSPHSFSCHFFRRTSGIKTGPGAKRGWQHMEEQSRRDGGTYIRLFQCFGFLCFSPHSCSQAQEAATGFCAPSSCTPPPPPQYSEPCCGPHCGLLGLLNFIWGPTLRPHSLYRTQVLSDGPLTIHLRTQLIPKLGSACVWETEASPNNTTHDRRSPETTGHRVWRERATDRPSHRWPGMGVSLDTQEVWGQLWNASEVLFWFVDHSLSQIEFVTILLLFYFLIFWPEGRWDLTFPSGSKPLPSALEGKVLTTGPPGKYLRKVLTDPLKMGEEQQIQDQWAGRRLGGGRLRPRGSSGEAYHVLGHRASSWLLFLVGRVLTVLEFPRAATGPAALPQAAQEPGSGSFCQLSAANPCLQVSMTPETSLRSSHGPGPPSTPRTSPAARQPNLLARARHTQPGGRDHCTEGAGLGARTNEEAFTRGPPPRDLFHQEDAELRLRTWVQGADTGPVGV